MISASELLLLVPPFLKYHACFLFCYHFCHKIRHVNHFDTFLYLLNNSVFQRHLTFPAEFRNFPSSVCQSLVLNVPCATVYVGEACAGGLFSQ